MMKFPLLSLLLLVAVWSSHPGVVQAAPCETFTDQVACEAASVGTAAVDQAGGGGEAFTCLWCADSETCAELCLEDAEPIPVDEQFTVPAVDDADGGPCPRFRSETECASGDPTVATDCVWCSDIKACRTSEDACLMMGGGPPVDDGGGGGNQTDEMAYATGLVGDDDDDDDDGNDELKRGGNNTDEMMYDSGPVGDDDDDDDDGDVVCPPSMSEENCTLSCTWCPDHEICRPASKGCPGGELVVNDRIQCNPLQNETECLESGECFWCAAKEACRSDFGSCPGNEQIKVKRNLCAPLKNETECVDSGTCFWCEDKSLCRASEEECPGKGRGNICKDLLVDTDCDSAEGCTWLEGPERCSSQRGNPDRGNNETMPARGANLCPLLANEGNCTGHVQCRWCPGNEECLKASDACEDGSLGTRGNPCPFADSEDLCGGIDGCLWCVNANATNCRKATNNACSAGDEEGGDDDDDDGPGGQGNVCRLQDAQPECDEIEDCQWCEAQNRCKKNQTECADPSGDVDIDLGEQAGGAFKIRDDGLGPSDPNSVSVVLSYLYEITEEGEIIESSLVDLENQDFEVKQTIGTFFGGIEARRIHLEAAIEGVGTIALDAYIMLQNGTISAPGGTETWQVEANDVKFNVEMSQWTFCSEETPCGSSNGTSSFIDLAFDIRGNSESPDQSEENALLFSLGGNVPLLLSSQVEVDGFVQDMPEGFPRAESTESQGLMFVFRVPKFRESSTYDPIIPYHYSIPILTDEVTTDAPVSVATKAPAPLPTVPPTDAPVKAPAKKDEEDDSLSGGAIAGIVIGALLGMCCCCALGAMYAVKKREKSGEDDDSELKANITVDDEELFADETGGAGNKGGDDDDDDDDDDDEEESDDDEDEEDSDDEDDEEESDSDDDRMT